MLWEFATGLQYTYKVYIYIIQFIFILFYDIKLILIPIAGISLTHTKARAWKS